MAVFVCRSNRFNVCYLRYINNLVLAFCQEDWGIFRELKKENLLESNNVLIFTASTVTDQELKEMLSSGAKGVLRKPLSIDELIEAVERFS